MTCPGITIRRHRPDEPHARFVTLILPVYPLNNGFFRYADCALFALVEPANQVQNRLFRLRKKQFAYRPSLRRLGAMTSVRPGQSRF